MFNLLKKYDHFLKTHKGKCDPWVYCIQMWRCEVFIMMDSDVYMIQLLLEKKPQKNLHDTCKRYCIMTLTKAMHTSSDYWQLHTHSYRCFTLRVTEFCDLKFIWRFWWNRNSLPISLLPFTEFTIINYCISLYIPYGYLSLLVCHSCHSDCQQRSNSQKTMHACNPIYPWWLPSLSKQQEFIWLCC